MSRVQVKGRVNKVFLKPWVMDPLQYHGYGTSTSGGAPFYLTPFAGTHCAHPLRAGQAEWTWVASYMGRLFTCSHMVTHFSTNRARRRAVILIKASAYCILLLLLLLLIVVVVVVMLQCRKKFCTLKLPLEHMYLFGGSTGIGLYRKRRLDIYREFRGRKMVTSSGIKSCQVPVISPGASSLVSCI